MPYVYIDGNNEREVFIEFPSPETTYHKFFDNNRLNGLNQECPKCIFIIKFVNGTIKNIKCIGNQIFEVDTNKNISYDKILILIESVEIKSEIKSSSNSRSSGSNSSNSGSNSRSSGSNSSNSGSNSRSSGSNSSNSGSNISNSGSNSRSSGSNSSQEKVEKKVDTLINENDDKRTNIIAAIKSFGYLNKILTFITLNGYKYQKNVIDYIIDKILNRMADILITEKDEVKKTKIIKIIGYFGLSDRKKIEVIFKKRIEDKVVLSNLLKDLLEQNKEMIFMVSQIRILRDTQQQIKEELQKKQKTPDASSSSLLEDINNVINRFITNPHKIDKQKLLNIIDLNKSHLKYLKEKELVNSICSRIITPKQVGNTCWFMAAIVAMFYSQRSRDVIIKKSEDWGNSDPLFMLLQIVLNRYVTTYKKDNYPKFSDNIFVDILRLLFKVKGGNFPYDPDNVSHMGFYTVVYICKLYKLLGIDYKIFDFVDYSTLAYSYYNKEYDVVSYNSECKEELNRKNGFKEISYTKDSSTPPILMIRIIKANKITNYLYKNILKSNTNIDEKIKKQLTSMKDKICYNGKVYILDSVILDNWNDKDLNHVIAGITCEGHKYVYNGWVRTAIDNVIPNDFKQRTPCELMPYDWNIRTEANFCLNNATCIPDILKKGLTNDMLMELMKTDLCYDFGKGARRLIYVRQDTTCDDKDEVV
uniref:Uncharacterized protein n=1 Tax=viral metagenome TaxID=1070528 RepID=A0A6C0LNR8_9ZZZZ